MNLKSCLCVLVFGLGAFCAGAAGAEPRAELGDKGKTEARAADRGVEVRLYYEEKPQNGEMQKTPKLDILLSGKAVFSMASEEAWRKWPFALVQIVEMDPSNPYPEIVFTTYTGGAHCCSAVHIGVSGKDGKSWRRVDAGMYDGDASGVEDANGDGRYELVTVDNRFLYAFSSYAGSVAPTQIHQLQKGKLVDVTRDAAFRARLLKDHEHIRTAMGDINKAHEKNGFLAGYVAQSALIGSGAQAWDFMLKTYDRAGNEGLSQCGAGYDKDSVCKAPVVRFKDFPQALAVFLRNAGYLPAAR